MAYRLKACRSSWARRAFHSAVDSHARANLVKQSSRCRLRYYQPASQSGLNIRWWQLSHHHFPLGRVKKGAQPSITKPHFNIAPHLAVAHFGVIPITLCYWRDKGLQHSWIREAESPKVDENQKELRGVSWANSRS